MGKYIRQLTLHHSDELNKNNDKYDPSLNKFDYIIAHDGIIKFGGKIIKGDNMGKNKHKHKYNLMDKVTFNYMDELLDGTISTIMLSGNNYIKYVILSDNTEYNVMQSSIIGLACSHGDQSPC